MRAPAALSSHPFRSALCALVAFGLALSSSPSRAQSVELDGFVPETYLDGLDEPVAFDFVGPDELFVLQRDGQVFWYRDGARVKRVMRLRVHQQGERGGLGLAVGPDFDDDGAVFLHYSARGGGGAWTDNRVVRATFNGNRLAKPKTVLSFGRDNRQENDPELVGGTLRVGSDGYLYGQVGAFGRGSADRIEQNGDAGATSGAGGIFRIDPSGAIPADNPFADHADPVVRSWFAYGFRDGRGMDFDPVTGDLWFSEVGPGVWDEINHSVPGMNGGWLKIAGPDARDATYDDNGGTAHDADDLVMLAGSAYRDPAFSWADSTGVSALAFLATKAYGGTLRNELVAADGDGDLYLFDLARRRKLRDGLQLQGALADGVADDAGEAAALHWGDGFGRVADMRVGPDGLLYVLDRSGGRLLRLVTAPDPDPTARYRVTFEAVWSASTHPDPLFPGNPHFSGLIGGTHDSGVVFWAPGSLASDGIERMAEVGSKPLLQREVEAAIAAGTAASVLSGGGIALSPGFVSMEFDIGVDHPLVTLVSMVAPSPDWFVGVRDLPLLVNGVWREEVAVDMFVYDAGTDSGTTFNAADDDTNPAEPITRITTAPFAGSTPVGTFTFERIDS